MVKAIKALARHVDLLDPEAVKLYLADKEVSESRKAPIADALQRFYR